MLTQVVPTKLHAVEDYLTGSTLPYAARKLGVTPPTQRILDSVATMATAQSMVTDYEGGLLRLLPMRMHLISDALMGVGLLSLAAFMRGRPKRDRMMMGGLGAFSIVYALMTKSTPSDRS